MARQLASMRHQAEQALIDGARRGPAGSDGAIAHFQRRLDEMGATYTPVADSPVGPVVVFRDPDGIQGEFFLPA